MKNIRISRFGIPVKSNKKILITVIWFVLAVIMLVLTFKLCIMLSYQLYPYAEDSTSHATWIAALPSYWGGIIGGLISGLIALIGTLLIIKYYRNSDNTSKIFENIPFLKINICRQALFQVTNPLFCIGSGDRCHSLGFKIKNIGKGFAQTLVYYDDSSIVGKEFLYTIEKDTELERTFIITVNYTDSFRYNFAFMFLDCFGNEFIQEYELCGDFNENGDVNPASIGIVSLYPILTDKAIR